MYIVVVSHSMHLGYTVLSSVQCQTTNEYHSTIEKKRHHSTSRLTRRVWITTLIVRLMCLKREHNALEA